ncbi:MAG: ATP-binding cassette domain-containing protein [Clostridia bacterium]|jgi:ABC-type lipoprotein export system ATPase subunit|nr:ATP-binding cassette domain-containing protein [Clostridia bacterium]
MIKEITILPGKDKNDHKENFDQITLKAGETISIVGPTGSGKTAFITDIELLAQGDTSTGRYILINGKKPAEEVRYDPAQKPIAMITQNTKCFADLSVEEFLYIHARARKINNKKIVNDTMRLANKFTGEKITLQNKVTLLSGGQTRSLLIADALLIGAAPIILLDEIENAGIFKQEVIEIIKSTSKIIIFVTHDPVIALLTKKRLIMSNGGVRKIVSQNESESGAAKNLLEYDQKMGVIRENLRAGFEITKELVSANFA